jgi:hypothetical protein
VNKVMARARWGPNNSIRSSCGGGKRHPPGLAVFGLTASQTQMARKVVSIYSTSLKRCSKCNHCLDFFRLCDDGEWTVKSSLVHMYR